MLLLVLKKPGLQGGHWVFTPEAGSFTDPSRSSPQIFGMAHLYMSCVCKHEVSKSQHGWDLGHVSNQNTSKRKRSGFEKEHVSMLNDTRTERVSDLNSKPCPLAPPPAWVHHADWWGVSPVSVSLTTGVGTVVKSKDQGTGGSKCATHLSISITGCVGIEIILVCAGWAHFAGGRSFF